MAQRWPNSVEVCPSRPKFGRIRPNSAQTWPKTSQTRSKLAQVGRRRPKLAKSGRTRPDVHRPPPHLVELDPTSCQRRAQISRWRLKLAKRLGRSWPNVAPSWAKDLAEVGSTLFDTTEICGRNRGESGRDLGRHNRPTLGKIRKGLGEILGCAGDLLQERVRRPRPQTLRRHSSAP